MEGLGVFTSMVTQNAYLTKVDIKDAYLTAQADLATVLDHLQILGFPINWKKSVLTPAQVMEFLGMTIDTQQMKGGTRVPALQFLALKINNKLVHRCHSVVV
ncbi:hypothetical protein H4R33_007111, partial [Dimargaris cristalligena]